MDQNSITMNADRQAQLQKTGLADKQLTSLLETQAALPERDSIKPKDLVYLGSRLVMTTLPHQKPEVRKMVEENGNRKLTITEVRQVTHENGNLKLTITAMNEVISLPYGIFPRLILIWICSEVVRTGSKRIALGRSFAEFMRRVGVVNEKKLPSGKKHKAVKTKHPSTHQHKAVMEQLLKLLSTGFSVFLKNENRTAGANIIIAKDYDLWNVAGKDSYIDLTEEFFAEIARPAVPFVKQAVMALKKSSMDLDVFLWATYRTVKLPGGCSRPMPFESLRQQFGAAYARLVDFRRQFLQSLERVRIVWPDFRFYVDDSGRLVLIKCSSMVPQKLQDIIKDAKAEVDRLGRENNHVIDYDFDYD